MSLQLAAAAAYADLTQIAAVRKTSKFEDEIRMEQEERKREEEERRIFVTCSLEIFQEDYSYYMVVVYRLRKQQPEPVIPDIFNRESRLYFCHFDCREKSYSHRRVTISYFVRYCGKVG